MLSLDKPGVYLMPSFITANGGSKVESFWSQFNGVPSGPGTGLELMHRLSRAYVLRKNLKAGVHNRGQCLRGRCCHFATLDWRVIWRISMTDPE